MNEFLILESKIKRRKKPSFRESDLQRNCVKWFRLQYPQYAKLLFAIPNGGKRNAREAARMKAEGVQAGVPDLFLAMPMSEHAGLWIELKSGDNGLTSAQKEMFKELIEWNYSCWVVRSIDEFIHRVTNYIHAK